MANQKNIEATYDYMDDIFQESIGRNSDISCAMYNGDFSLSLEEAQKAKHDFILNVLNFKKGDKILDIGCGWGPVLKAVKENGGEGVGLTLSPAQAQACAASGLVAHIKDWKEIKADEFEKFDGITVVEPFEHFCSKREMLESKQDEIYNRFFKLCYTLLKPHGRLYLQTMVWGKKVPRAEDLNVSAPKLSDAWVIGHLDKFYPESWLANGKDHIEKCAQPFFTTVLADDGRVDYIQTMKEFGKRTSKFSFKKTASILRLLPKYISDKNFRYQITSFRYSCNRLCFERDLMRLPRMVLEAN
ncbi:MAG: class I SAM-dependent methyltransferase [Bacteroidota bacterium]|nr:class I SAM-dependent methyltransferase [Bacteroidota bacterium]